MSQRILVTGSGGLVGSAVKTVLQRVGYSVQEFDKRYGSSDSRFGDILNMSCLERAVEGCSGIVHLAAVSRVAWGEKDPKSCFRTNVDGTANVLAAAARSPVRPWILFSSSREVYGEPDHLPVKESDPLAPVNVYGRSKRDGETLVLDARRAGQHVGIVRLANVYGSAADHADRAAPAFARRALDGRTLNVFGPQNAFDFTHVSDVARGILASVRHLEQRPNDIFPTLHFVTGVPTTLGELAHLATRMARSNARVIEHPLLDYNVSRFVGDPALAEDVLGWKAVIRLDEGLNSLISEYRAPVDA